MDSLHEGMAAVSHPRAKVESVQPHAPHVPPGGGLPRARGCPCATAVWKRQTEDGARMWEQWSEGWFLMSGNNHSLICRRISANCHTLKEDRLWRSVRDWQLLTYNSRGPISISAANKAPQMYFGVWSKLSTSEYISKCSLLETAWPQIFPVIEKVKRL